MRVNPEKSNRGATVESQPPTPNYQPPRWSAWALEVGSGALFQEDCMRQLLLAVICIGLSLTALAAQAPAPQQPPAGPPPPDTAALRQQYEQWRKNFKTWGKWAPVGQESKGTTALITAEKVRDAMKLVKSGIAISLAHAEPQQVAADVGAAGLFKRTTLGITEGGTTDNYSISFHGQTVAHIDSWCHFFENGQMYNGVPVQGNLSAETGCVKGGIMNWKDGITTRAEIGRAHV